MIEASVVGIGYHRRMPAALRACALVIALTSVVASAAAPDLDPNARRWVERTLAAMTAEEKAAQLVMAAVDTTYLSTDTDAYEKVAALVRDRKVGGLIVFGGTEPMPPVLLNPTYGTVVLGDPLSAASTLNHLQRLARVPLLTAGDFEFGVGMRIRGATQLPRAMAFGAAGDERLTEEAGRMTAAEMRALGVHVNFAPVADVNNNPRNPVINTRSFGEDPARVGALASAFVRGLQQGGVLATLKHFPGHGDTDVDTHVGLATLPHDRSRLDALELVPFRAGIAAGAESVMTGHLALPGIGEADGVPATLSRKAVDLLRQDLKFNGLVFTDSLKMAAVAKMASPGEIAVRAVEAGNDIVLDSPDPDAAVTGLADALRSGRLSMDRVNASVTRILEAKARLKLQNGAAVDLERVADRVGGRAHQAVADSVAERAVTLLKDERSQVPMTVPPDAQVLHLSVLDYPAGWRLSPPGRVFIPALKAQWPAITAIELSDRSTTADLELVRAMAPRFDAIVVAVYVRAASGSGRMDLAPSLVRLVQDLTRSAGTRPMIVCLFGNPYVASLLSDAASVLLTYDFSIASERAAARALRGIIPIGGRLPIALPGLAPVGAGLNRQPAGAPSASGASAP
jgi:beta-glucosidase-like glycosyl hydrolase